MRTSSRNSSAVSEAWLPIFYSRRPTRNMSASRNCVDTPPLASSVGPSILRSEKTPSFHVDDANLDPKTWYRFPILSGGFVRELAELRASADIDEA